MANDEPEILLAERTAQLMKAKQLQAELAEQKRTEDALRLSQKRLQLAVRASNTGFWDWDALTREIYFSREWKAQIGYEDHELDNRMGVFEDRLHPDDRERVLSSVRAYFAKPGSSYEVEFRLRHKDGSYRWILARATLFTDDHGKPQRMLGTHVDITERKRAEEALRTSERLYRTLAHNFPNGGVALFDRELRYMIADGSDLARVGLSKEGLEGKTIWEAFSPELSQTLEPVYRTALAGKSTVEEIRLQGRVYLRHAVPVSDERGEIFAGMVMSQDITEHKEAAEALRRSEERYRLIVEGQTEFIVKWLPDGTRTFVNESYCRYFGVSEEDCLATSFFPLVAPEFREAIRLKTASLTPDAPDYTEEHVSIVPDGQRWQQWTNRGIFDDDGKLIELLSTGRDITDRRRAEEALTQSEAHYRALVENTPDIIARFDRDCRYRFVNSAVSQVSKLKPEDVVGRSLRQAGFSDEQASFREEVIRNVFETQTPFETEFEIDGLNGGRVFEWRVFPEFDEKGSMQTVLSINRDISERRRAEEQLKQSREQLRALSSHLQSVREEERTHIAREVHDELGQALTALKLDLYDLRRGVTKEVDRDVDRLTAKINSMSSLIDTTIQSVRRIATELRPGILDDLGLVAAIEWQANDFQTRTGICCEVASSVDYLELDRDRSTATFRIFQETLTNVARHAGASKVAIELKQDDAGLVLEVKDNGKGITASDISASRSLGLLGMRERAQLLGGDLVIAGTAGIGTLVTVSIPL